jgi:DNA-binding transcriptional MerR regulator
MPFSKISDPNESATDKTSVKLNTYKIGELADLTKTTTRTLRYYEELGLLKPIRNNSGQRLYGDAAVERLKFINELKSGGFSLLEVKTFFESWQNNETGAEAALQTVGVIQQKMTEVAELQAKISRLNDELRSMINFLVACRTCEDRPSLENCGDCSRQPEKRAPNFILNLLKDRSVVKDSEERKGNA